MSATETSESGLASNNTEISIVYKYKCCMTLTLWQYDMIMNDSFDEVCRPTKSVNVE